MALQGTLIQNVPANTAEIDFYNPTLLDSVSYSSSGISYPVANSYSLNQSDFSLFYNYKSQLYNFILANFPSVVNSYNNELPVCFIEVQSLSGPNIIQYYQKSTASPVNLVYNISFDRGTLTATFAARTNQITITFQEFLFAFFILKLYASQIALA